MADIFEYLEFQAEEDNEPLRKAASIAVSRAELVFPFLEKAQNRNEFDSRLALVQDKINDIVIEACEEFGYNDTEHVSKIVRGQIELIAADVETGDSYYQRRDDLPSADQHGNLSGEPSPKLNPDKAGDQWHTSQDEPEVESVRHRNDRQNAQDLADYASDYNDDSPLVNRVDADTPMQPEFWAAPHTDVFPNKGQAQPVTSSDKKVQFMDDPKFDRDAFLDAHRKKSPRQLAEEQESEIAGDWEAEKRMEAEKRGSNTEAEFRKCVEDYVKNGMPPEAALKHDDFAGLQETAKFNIINEYRGDKKVTKKKSLKSLKWKMKP